MIKGRNGNAVLSLFSFATENVGVSDMLYRLCKVLEKMSDWCCKTVLAHKQCEKWAGSALGNVI